MLSTSPRLLKRDQRASLAFIPAPGTDKVHSLFQVWTRALGNDELHCPIKAVHHEDGHINTNS